MLNQESLIDDITRRAQEGLLSEAYGRTREMYTIFEILARRNRSNVLLVGDAGVGKRRIVEGLALSGVRGEAEEVLGEYRVVELNLAMLAQGGDQHDKALGSLVKHLRQTRDIILFIPDIDIVLAPETGELSDTNLGRLLRPTLVRGEITCIGATTPERYQHLATHDPATNRSFEKVDIRPMTEAQAYDVICAIRPEIESHHAVEIADETVRAAVILSERYVKNQFLPGKAIDILDRASSRYRLKKLAKIRQPELVDEASLVNLREQVSPHDVRKAIENVTGVEIRAGLGKGYWDDLASAMRRKIMGQSAAIREGSAAIQKTYDALSDTPGPKCAMLFVGPRGCGKKYWAETIAESHLGSKDRYIEVDARTATDSSLAETLQEVADRGIDSGSGDAIAGMLRLPESILFVRGGEDRSTATVNRIRSILSGTVRVGPGGRQASLHNCIVLIAAEHDDALPERAPYKTSPKSWRVGLRQAFAPEILNKVDAIVPFFALEFRHFHTVMRADVNELRKRLSRKGVTVIVHRRAYELLAEGVRDAGEGIPALRKAVFGKMIRPIERLLEDSEVTGHPSIRVDSEDGRIRVRLEPSENVSERA